MRGIGSSLESTRKKKKKAHNETHLCLMAHPMLEVAFTSKQTVFSDELAGEILP